MKKRPVPSNPETKALSQSLFPFGGLGYANDHRNKLYGISSVLDVYPRTKFFGFCWLVLEQNPQEPRKESATKSNSQPCRLANHFVKNSIDAVGLGQM